MVLEDCSEQNRSPRDRHREERLDSLGGKPGVWRADIEMEVDLRWMR
jgi:hypothetical protein